MIHNRKLNHSQKLFTSVQWAKLLANYNKNWKRSIKGLKNTDPRPVVKLFNPYGAQTWLLSECDEQGTAFGLCDLGLGCAELGYVSMDEICNIGYIERDLHFHPKRKMSEYVQDAEEIGRIVT